MVQTIDFSFSIHPKWSKYKGLEIARSRDSSISSMERTKVGFILQKAESKLLLPEFSSVVI